MTNPLSLITPTIPFPVLSSIILWDNAIMRQASTVQGGGKRRAGILILDVKDRILRIALAQSRRLPCKFTDQTKERGGKLRPAAVASRGAFLFFRRASTDQSGGKRRREGSFGALYFGYGVSTAPICFNRFGTVPCEDVGPFQSSKLRPPRRPFLLGAHRPRWLNEAPRAFSAPTLLPSPA
jgi:hypothetical protein